jgi:DNA polymerase III delta prime subunit
MSLFRKASRTQSRLRLAFIGPSGSGKTWTALAVAHELASQLGSGRIAVIDTEHGSASKYAGSRFSFDSLELVQFDPRAYIEAIQAAESERYDVLIIDSLSHAWSGKGGALELVDKAAKRSKSNNTFTSWRDVTPLHNALIDAIIGCNCHVIATMRSKVDYVMESDPTTGKMVPKKVGLAPIQREGMDYEFDVVGDIDLDHNLAITKTRCEKLDGEVFNKPGKKFAEMLVEWLSDGAPAGQTASPASQESQPTQNGHTSAAHDKAMDQHHLIRPAVSPRAVPQHMIDDIHRLIALTGMSDYQVRSALARRGVAEISHLAIEDAQSIIHNLESIASKTTFANMIGTEPVNRPSELQTDSRSEERAGPVPADTSQAQSDGPSDAQADSHEIGDVTRAVRSSEPVPH